MLPKKQQKAYSDFYESARYNKILEPKTTLMIHIATAMAVGCSSWVKHYLGVAKEQGITDDELGTAQSIVMAISGCNIRNKTEDGSILPKKQSKTFSDFYGSARDNEILSPKTTIKIQIAAALAFGCQIWLKRFFGVAKEQGITDDEIGAVASIVMAVAAGRISTQFREACAISKAQSK